MPKREAIGHTISMLLFGVLMLAVCILVVSGVDALFYALTGIDDLGSWIVLGGFFVWIALSEYRKARRT